MLIFTSDVWVTIDINHANFIFVANRISWWQAFQVGSGSIKMYVHAMYSSTEWWSYLRAVRISVSLSESEEISQSFAQEIRNTYTWAFPCWYNEPAMGLQYM
jgi:hypothetical protein